MASPGPSRHPRAGARLVLALLLVMVGFVATSGLRADEVLVVVSSGTGPYAEAAGGCEDALRAAGHTPKRVGLDALSETQMEKRTGAVVAIGADAARSLSEHLPAQTRLYYCMTPSPEQLGLTDRANTSGLSTNPDTESQIKLIEDSGLGVRRVGLLFRAGNSASAQAREAFEEALPDSWTLVAVDLDEEGSVAGAIKALFKSDIDLVWTSADPAVYNATLIKALLLDSLRNKVPVFGFSHALVRAGAALGIGIDPEEQGKRVAEMLNAGQTDVHAPPALHLGVNLIVAERIGTELSDKFVRRAELVYRAD